MQHIVQLPGPAFINRAVHFMAVIVVILFAFHFARLAGFTAGAILAAAAVALAAAASMGLRRQISVDASAQRVTTTVMLLSIPLHTRITALPGMAWAGVRRDLPDLVVDVGSTSGEAVEVLRFRNAYGAGEDMAADACSRLARALQLEDRGQAAA